MKRSILITLTLVCLGVVAAVAQSSTSPAVTAVKLQATIEPTDSSGVACKICSDGGGAYVDGQGGVAASFNINGNLNMQTQTGRTAQRFVRFDYSTPYTGFDIDPAVTPHTPTTGAYADVYLSTFPESDAGYIALQNLPIGVSEGVRLVWYYVLKDANQTQWRHGFQMSSALSGFDESQTSYGVVTRVDNNTWRVEPTGGCGICTPRVARLIDAQTAGNLVINNDGLYLMPFRLTLVRTGKH